MALANSFDSPGEPSFSKGRGLQDASKSLLVCLQKQTYDAISFVFSCFPTLCIKYNIVDYVDPPNGDLHIR